jgi:uncharacterized protein involved in oxidation of intracellular sulfur
LPTRTVTLVVDSAPYETEGPYNALRLTRALLASGGAASVNVFLLADGVYAAVRDRAPETATYSTQGMLSEVLAKGVRVVLCGTCCADRGITEADILAGTTIGTMADLADWVLGSDTVLSF